MSLLSSTSASAIASLVDAMNEAADALSKHQAQANRVRTKTTRTTVMGPGGTKSALPTKDAIHALVVTIPEIGRASCRERV